MSYFLYKAAFAEAIGTKNDSNVISMAGSRPLTPREERVLLRHIRRINARDCALISAQLFLGFRISEVLALTIGRVWDGSQVRQRVALPPRFLKGGYGTTRTIPIGPELRRALERYLAQRGRHEELRPNAPLFLSPRHRPDGAQKSICLSIAEKSSSKPWSLCARTRRVFRRIV